MDYTVLIVDDNPSAIEILKSALHKDYNLRIVTNGEMAIEIIKKSLPDLILLDVMMPGMNGFEVCKILKDCVKTKDIPVIFVTIMSDVYDENEGFNIGAVDYIAKPINAVTVKARVKTHLSLAHQQKELDVQVREKTKELNKSRIDLVKQLGIAAEYKDNEIGNHITRVSKYCGLIADKYGYSENDSSLLVLAAPMHDVGKIAIEDRILNKPGKLTATEWKRVKEHTTIGVKILGKHEDPLLKLASSIISQHHEKWDGTGYPNGYKGTEIDINSRILAIADVFDALTNKRSYKEAWTFEESFEYISNDGGHHFDPDLVKVFGSLKREIYAVYNEFID